MRFCEKSAAPMLGAAAVIALYALCFPLYMTFHLVSAILSAAVVYCAIYCAANFREDRRIITLRRLILQVKNEKIREKAGKICELCSRIFSLHEKRRTRLVENYYLPTAKKLLKTHISLEKHGGDRDCALKTEKTLDAFIISLEKLEADLRNTLKCEISGEARVAREVAEWR